MSWDQNEPEPLAQAHSILEGLFRAKGYLRLSEKPFGESFPQCFWKIREKPLLATRV